MPHQRPLFRGAQILCLWALLTACCSRFMVDALVGEGDLHTPRMWILYQAGTLGFNYFDFGAIRRGLAGSIVHLVPTGLVDGTLIWHLMCSAGLSALVLWLWLQARLTRPQRLIFLGGFVALALRWGDDGGRIDMAVAACLVAATLAVVKGRPVLSTALIGLGLLVHETSLIFGLPLLVALLWQRGGWKAFSARQRGGFAAVGVLTGLAYLSPNLLPHADIPTMVDGVRAKLPPHQHVDWAIYYAVSGLRGVRTSVCQNAIDPNNWLHPLGGLILIGVAYRALGGGRRAALKWALLAALPGFAFLCAVANDDSRWAVFACFNVWLVMAAARPPEGHAPSPWVPGKRSVALMLAFAVLLVYRSNNVPHRIYVPSPFVEAIVSRLGGPPTPSVDHALEHCDPGWRDVLGDVYGPD